jgi:hypothetical protein
MATYRITNITNTVGKRDFKYNSPLDVSYVDGMMKKTVKVKPGGSIYLTVQTLPLSIHRLRVKGLVTVIEVTSAEVNAEIKKAAKSAPTPIKPVEETKKMDDDADIKRIAKKKVQVHKDE